MVKNRMSHSSKKIPKEQVSCYWSLLDASIIHLKKASLFETVIPSKLFESLGMGVPVLHGVMGESANIVQSDNVGITFEPENAKSLVSSIHTLKNDGKLLSTLRGNCHVAAKKYERSKLAKEMLTILEKISLAEKAKKTPDKKKK